MSTTTSGQAATRILCHSWRALGDLQWHFSSWRWSFQYAWEQTHKLRPSWDALWQPWVCSALGHPLQTRRLPRRLLLRSTWRLLLSTGTRGFAAPLVVRMMARTARCTMRSTLRPFLLRWTPNWWALTATLTLACFQVPTTVITVYMRTTPTGAHGNGREMPLPLGSRQLSLVLQKALHQRRKRGMQAPALQFHLPSSRRSPPPPVQPRRSHRRQPGKLWRSLQPCPAWLQNISQQTYQKRLGRSRRLSSLVWLRRTLWSVWSATSR
mmetsp:Transcript_117933/g.328575  ORF Transcript_117933/g.328575 Transcript_117933/m.328575 type:complete len:267 (-) Transcript_117933:869-1669(-)